MPTVPVPAFGDKIYFADELHRAGVATRPLPFNRLTAARLAERIDAAAGDAGMRARAAELAAEMRAEGGVHEAVERISALEKSLEAGAPRLNNTRGFQGKGLRNDPGPQS